MRKYLPAGVPDMPRGLRIAGTAGLLLLLCSAELPAQGEKREVERDIVEEQMPAPALAVLDVFGDAEGKVDYYLETDGQQTTFEAKFDLRGHTYSVEFSETGSLLDIEQQIQLEEIEESVRSSIVDEIGEVFSDVRFSRIQRQYSAPDLEGELVAKSVLAGNCDRLQIRYEIEIEAETGRQLGFFELLFDEGGNLIQQRRIVRRSLDNVW